MSLYGPSYQPRNKLRREGIERTVLPPLPGGHTYSAAYTYAGVGHTGYQKSSSSSASILTGSTRGGGGLLSGSSTAVGSTGARVRERIEEVKERQKERRERHKTRTRPDEIQKSNLVVDADGVAHDSEYVQFRTATPVHVQARTARRNRREVEGIPNDDDSASSASSSSSSSQGSGFQSSPYTYQSTHRTTSTSQHHHHHHHSSALYPPTRSAIPGYLAAQSGRSSLDGGGLTVPRAPSPAKRSSNEYDRSSLDRGGSNSSLRPSASRLRPTGGQQFSTSSFQPPAAFNPVPPSMQLSANQPPLRNATSVAQPPLSSGDAHSLTSSTARLSLGTTNPNESGYNKFARSDKQRGERKEGNVLDAGVHGMKRSWDGFKLDMRFGAHKVGKKVSRKLTTTLNV
ncbi:hypothetical protein JCM3765_002817 [Sporobolomyces pararoseus]